MGTNVLQGPGAVHWGLDWHHKGGLRRQRVQVCVLWECGQASDDRGQISVLFAVVDSLLSKESSMKARKNCGPGCWVAPHSSRTTDSSRQCSKGVRLVTWGQRMDP